jgi:hypothetical protein
LQPFTPAFVYIIKRNLKGEKNMKKTIFMLLTLVFLVSFTACQKAPTPDNNTEIVKAPENTTETTIYIDLDDEILDEGIYVGQIDNNSIEVNIHGSAMAFRFSETAKISFSGLKLNLGDRIFVRYYINDDGQFILTNISK